MCKSRYFSRWGMVILGLTLGSILAVLPRITDWLFGDIVVVRPVTSLPTMLSDGGDLVSKFEIHNKGRTSVEFGRIERICSCQQVELDRRIIHPDEKAILTVETTNRESDVEVVRDVLVKFRGKKTGILRVPLRIPKVGPNALAINSIEFATIQVGERTQRALRTADKSVRIESVDIQEFDEPYLSVVTMPCKDGARNCFSLLLDGSQVVGQVFTSVRVNMIDSDGVKTDKQIVCRGLVSGPVRGIPPIGIITTRRVATFSFECAGDFVVESCTIAGRAAKHYTASKTRTEVTVKYLEHEPDRIMRQILDPTKGGDGSLWVTIDVNGVLFRLSIPLIVDSNSGPNLK